MAKSRLARFVLLAALCVFGAVPSRSEAAAYSRVAVGRAVESYGTAVYPITVLSRGLPVIAVLPDDARSAALEVDGVVVQRTGSNAFVGHQPLGHGGVSLLLENLRPGQRVALLVTGTRTAPRILAADPLVATAAQTGLGSGFLLGLLVMAMLFQLIAIYGNRDWTRFWYLGALTALFCATTLRDDLWHLSVQGGDAALIVCGIAMSISMVGFVATYLRLYDKARGLLWLSIVFCSLPGLFILPLEKGLPHFRDAVVLGPALIATSTLIIVAALRWRARFKPAALLLSGLCALGAFLAVGVGLDVSGYSIPWIGRWGFEAAAAFDVIVFSLGVAYSERFRKDERDRIKQELRSATFAAAHDPLTGLLNRRGLEAWVVSQPHLVATLLYLDLDGFKAVNDRGGHAAGDDMLRLFARILRHAVREGDQCARLGGDEFLVVLPGLDEEDVVRQVVHRIVTAVALVRPLGAHDSTRVGASVGMARLDGTATFVEALREADANLYRQKSEHQAVLRAIASGAELPMVERRVAT